MNKARVISTSTSIITVRLARHLSNLESENGDLSFLLFFFRNIA